LLIRRKALRVRLLLLLGVSNLTFSLILVEVCLELADQELREVRVVVLVVHNYLVANHYARFLVGLAHWGWRCRLVLSHRVPLRRCYKLGLLLWTALLEPHVKILLRLAGFLVLVEHDWIRNQVLPLISCAVLRLSLNLDEGRGVAGGGSGHNIELGVVALLDIELILLSGGLHV